MTIKDCSSVQAPSLRAGVVPALVSDCAASRGSPAEAFSPFFCVKEPELRCDSNHRTAAVLQTPAWGRAHAQASASERG